MPYNFKPKTSTKWNNYRKFKKTYPKNKTIYVKPKAEMKYMDVQLGHNLSITPYIQLLNPIGQGDGQFGARIGKEIELKSIELSFTHFVVPTTGTDQTTRIALVQAKNVNGVAPTYNQIYTTNVVNSLRNLTNKTDYKILKVWNYSMNASGEPGSMKNINYYRKLNIKTLFQDASQTITGVKTNGLFLVTLSTADGTAASSITGNARVRYTDV
ncbi:capsid [uncultured virus]|uniref:Capsid n=1 Tax=uncultured virus TaxID=340016 RepID=A0A2K9LSX1_9VIRU|nr:capsid [uncultured virus]